MVFKALNNSISPNGLILTFLVFRAYPQFINTNIPLPTVS